MAHEITLTSRTAHRGDFAAPPRALRIVHSSDLHVGEGFTEPLHKGDGTAGLRVVLAAARAAAADLAILAGDTFEHNRLSAGLLDRAAALLAEAGMPVVILPGNHDPAITDFVFHRGIAAPENVRVIGVTHEAAVSFPDLALEIWGNAHRDYGDNAPLAQPQPRRSFWQIAVAHGHYVPAADRSTNSRPGWLISDDEIVAHPRRLCRARPLEPPCPRRRRRRDRVLLGLAGLCALRQSRDAIAKWRGDRRPRAGRLGLAASSLPTSLRAKRSNPGATCERSWIATAAARPRDDDDRTRYIFSKCGITSWLKRSSERLASA